MPDVSPTLTTLTGGNKIIFGQATINFASTATLAQSGAKTVAITGANIGDIAFICPQTNVTTGLFSAVVTAADEVSTYFNNYSAGTVDPASGVFTVGVIKVS